MAFTDHQKRCMLETYFRNGVRIDGQWVYSTRNAFVDFQESFPEVIVHFDKFSRTVHRLVKLFRETGSVGRKEGSGRPKVRNEENIGTVRQVIEEHPNTSIRHLQQRVNLSYTTCQRILKQDLHLHPYRLQLFHELLPNDRPRRQQFCQWFVENFHNNDELLEKTFFSDEAWFHLSGYVNSQNMRMWSGENPHYYTEVPLHSQKIGVWAAISRRRLIGPIFFEGKYFTIYVTFKNLTFQLVGTLNAERYRLEILTPFLETLLDDELAQGYFQQDGARIHTTWANLNFLMEFFNYRIISLNMPQEWPPRSCDLTACDFFLWPYIKNSIYNTPVVDKDDLRQRITNKFEEINNSPWMLENVIDSMKRRVRLCLHEGGDHIAHLL